MLPALVSDAALERANGRLWSVELIANALIGPVLGAFLIALWLPLPFVLNALAYAAAMLLVMRIAGPFRAQQSGSRSWRAELGQGFAFLMGAPLLRTLAWTTGFWNLLHQMVAIALVLHAQENFGIGAEAYGLMLAGGAVGGVIGSLAGDRVARVLGARADHALDAGCIAAGLCGDGCGARTGDGGTGLGLYGNDRTDLEYRVGQHPPTHDPGRAAGPGQQPVPAACMGDDSRGAGAVGRVGAGGRGAASAGHRTDAAVLGCGGGRGVFDHWCMARLGARLRGATMKRFECRSPALYM